MFNSLKVSKQNILFIVIILFATWTRLYRLDVSPPSPYWEEVALGYDAYSIKETLKDHHGNFLPITAFESFGDWKPALYFYAIVPFLYLFDLSLWAVRMPSVIAGIFIVWGIYRLARLFKVNPHLAAMITAISPWAIMFSRAGWEVNLATALIVWGIVFGIRGLIKSQKINHNYVISSIILLTFSAYTYHAARIIAPLLIISLVMVHWKTLQISMFKYMKRYINQLVIYGLIIIVLFAPLLKSMSDPQKSIRFAQTSIFTNLEIIQESNYYRELNGNSLMSRLFYHRYVLFGREILINFFSHLSPNFLFVSGDANPRHSSQLIGHLYYIELPLLLFGIYTLFRRYRRIYLILGLWLVIGIMPASVSYGAPHALRILPTFPVFVLVISLGIQEFIKYSQRKLPKGITGFIVFSIVVAYGLSFGQFWLYYQNVYPKVYASHWQYGYDELIQMIESYRLTHPETPIYISKDQGRPSMYYFFYAKTDPILVQQASSAVIKDQGELLVYDSMSFTDDIAKAQAGTLVASSPEKYQALNKMRNTKVIDSVNDLQGKPIWLIFEVLN